MVCGSLMCQYESASDAQVDLNMADSVCVDVREFPEPLQRHTDFLSEIFVLF